jgi:hypothetical protein
LALGPSSHRGSPTTTRYSPPWLWASSAERKSLVLIQQSNFLLDPPLSQVRHLQYPVKSLPRIAKSMVDSTRVKTPLAHRIDPGDSLQWIIDCQNRLWRFIGSQNPINSKASRLAWIGLGLSPDFITGDQMIHRREWISLPTKMFIKW